VDPVDERTAVRRLLQRAGFGPRPGDLDRAVATGFDATLAGLFAADAGASAPPPALRPLPADQARKPLTDEQQRQSRELMAAQLEQLRTWWLDRMIDARQPLTERLTLFWHGHFATSVQKVRSTALMLAQHQTLRRLGGGEFGALAKAMVVDPAMLLWLDAQESHRDLPNENLARELMELFTLGVGRYTELDVREAARALTGWAVDRATASSRLVRDWHDPGAKTVLGHTGPMDAAGLVDVLVAQPRCAEFITEALWARFVSHEPPPAERLQSLAGQFAAERNVRALLRAMLGCPEFRSPDAVLVREPVEWFVAGCRALGIRASTLNARRKLVVSGALQGMGQLLFAPPSVGGWPSGAVWLTPAISRARLTLATSMATAANLEPIKERPRKRRVEAVSVLLGVEHWTDRTAAALHDAAGNPAVLVTLALASPEYAVSG
jgi:uncharacterized protein (DUF1800 family)